MSRPTRAPLVALAFLTLAAGPAAAVPPPMTGGPAGIAGGEMVGMPGDPSALPFRHRPFVMPDVPLADLYPNDAGIPPVQASRPVDSDGVPMRVENGLLFVTPTGITFEGLRRLSAYVVTGDRDYLTEVERWARRLRTMMREEGDALWVRIPWDARDARLVAPWDNALAQGTALALYSRLHRLTGDPSWLAIADGLFRGFERLGPRDGPWVGHVVDGYLWFEHYVGGVRGRVLNAHLYAAFGLRDYWQETRSEEARLLAEAAFTTIRELGERFRRPGDYSRYNLTNPAVNANYHRFHIRQLRAATVATGDPWFAALAARMLADRRPPQPVGPWAGLPSPAPSPAPSPMPSPGPTPSPSPGPTPAPARTPFPVRTPSPDRTSPPAIRPAPTPTAAASLSPRG